MSYIPYFHSPPLEDMSEGNPIKRISRYVQRLEGSFHSIMDDPKLRNQVKLATHAVLEKYGVFDGNNLGVAEALTKYATRSWGYAKDPMKYEWFVSPLFLIRENIPRRMRVGRKIPPYGDCDDHAVAMACMLSSVGVEPYFLYLTKRVPFKFHHVTVAIKYGHRFVPMETINKHGRYPFGTCMPHVQALYKSPYRRVGVIITKSKVADALDIPTSMLVDFRKKR